MMYKVEYQYENDSRPHKRFYSALSPDTAKAMFNETCEESLVGYKVKIINVCKVGADASNSSHKEKPEYPAQGNWD